MWCVYVYVCGSVGGGGGDKEVGQGGKEVEQVCNQ